MSFPTRFLGAAVAMNLLGLVQAGPAPAFELKRFDNGNAVKLADFAGKIVVLDFFAYWCAPCAKSTPLIEEHLQRHYAAKQGNAHGVPVQVITVNVEPDESARTAAFIRKHGPSLVVNDGDGATLKRFGGASLPFLVVIDGTKGAAARPMFEVVYSHSGFEGAGKLRAVIDALGIERP